MRRGAAASAAAAAAAASAHQQYPPHMSTSRVNSPRGAVGVEMVILSVALQPRIKSPRGKRLRRTTITTTTTTMRLKIYVQRRQWHLLIKETR